MTVWERNSVLACIGLTTWFLAVPAGGQGAGAAPPKRESQAARTAKSLSAVEQMLEPGPEAEQLARRVGTWDVVMTLWPTPDAKPVVTKGLTAERTLIGLYLQEVMRPAPGSNQPDFRRIEYLTYDKLQGRWEYVSMDTRFPIGVMSARGFGDDRGPGITAYFEGFAIPGWGQEVEGRFVRARHVTTRESDDRDVTRQYWTQPGQKERLVVEYAYTRRR
jgi:hypothetical protein